MSDEKMKILKMLEEGKINADEAEKLIRAITKEKSGYSFMDIISESISGKEPGRELREEFKGKKLILEAKACDLKFKKADGSNFLLKGRGRFNMEKEGENITATLFGSGSLEIPEKSEVELEIKAGNLSGTVCFPFSFTGKMSNIELSVSEPVDIHGDIRMSNLVLSFQEPINRKFSISSSMSSVSEELGLEEKGEEISGVIGKELSSIDLNGKLSSIKIVK